jgi:MOSC domain-containing protein YiiM
MAIVESICISARKGVVKTPVEEAYLRAGHGLLGDAHAGTWHRQVSLLPQESIERVRAQLPELADGAFAENLVTAGLDLATVAVGDRIALDGGALLEVTQIGKKCHHGCVIREVTGDCIMPREGIFCRVLVGGPVRRGVGIRRVELGVAEVAPARSLRA